MGHNIFTAIYILRFQKLKGILHFFDNNKAKNNKNDRQFKVRKLIADAQNSFVKFGNFEEHLAVDEMIIQIFSLSCYEAIH